MENNVYLVKWYGPFESQEDVKDWEEEQQFKCSLYLIQGKLKYAKTRYKYYCGMSFKRFVYKRLKDKNHHISDFERLDSIYVGCLANIKHPTKNQILVIENTITASLAYIVGKDNILNEINTLFPWESVFVINEWWKTTGESVWSRQPKNTPPNIIPDVLTYHINDEGENELYCCKKLKRI